MRYQVQGIDERGSVTVLHDCDGRDDALRWARGYVRGGGYGGWPQIHLVDTTAPATHRLLRAWDPGDGEHEG